MLRALLLHHKSLLKKMSSSSDQNFLESSIKLFRYYKKTRRRCDRSTQRSTSLGKPNELSNSIALIVHHLSGNMLSRWTDFLTSDGEKAWRDREANSKNRMPIKQKCWRLGRKDGNAFWMHWKV